MNLFKIDYNVLVRLLLPTFLRKPVMIAFPTSAVSQISWLYGSFMRARENDLFCESIDSTVPRLEFLLNTMFYPDGLVSAYNYRIVVGNLKKRSVMRIWLGGIMQATDEGKPVFLGEKYLYSGAEAGEISSDFAVNVPAAVVFNEARMRAVLQQYVLPGKSFEIVKY